jgi:hypothetical protein
MLWTLRASQQTNVRAIPTFLVKGSPTAHFPGFQLACKKHPGSCMLLMFIFHTSQHSGRAIDTLGVTRSVVVTYSRYAQGQRRMCVGGTFSKGPPSGSRPKDAGPTLRASAACIVS